MGKIYRYELKRLLFNKFFIGILAVTLFYGYQVLTLEVVRGISHTAPFSAWSFGYYLARVLPLVCIGELFFLTFFVSKAEKRVAVLTNATPVNERRYLLTRSLAALTGTALLAGTVLVLGVLFLYRLFGPQAYGALVLPAILVLLPAILFCLGLGWLLGRAHPAGVYGAMVLALLLSVAPLPIEAGFSLSAFFCKNAARHVHARPGVRRAARHAAHAAVLSAPRPWRAALVLPGRGGRWFASLTMKCAAVAARLEVRCAHDIMRGGSRGAGGSLRSQFHARQ
ncbi:hypothetical protein RWV98_07500 [Agathobaculum sp. NTUH-O15-33]|uniref:hypothetical protein n=1 Tax=Agathobaculum sp. NTUH-O15-33 TaxID=3079302 RepID=UPI002958CD95|nr:hypothetical protein [Agathobaculum sp. NTUH-O15-33]WNX86108.1 hypothetical protein RWV98_07500 [Agathobaculum sp. NTUH-O15-33]